MIPRLHLHLPNLGIGGTERWALALMAGFPEVRWSVSIPDVVASAPVENPELAEVQIIAETDAAGCSDALITTWGFHRTAPEPVISVAHAVFPAYREMMRATPHDHAVAVSKAARSVFEDREAPATIYNGIDFARLAPTASRVATRERLSLPKNAMVVGFVGRWGHQKNPLAAALAASTIPGAIALYVGPPPEQDWLRRAEALCEIRLVTPEQEIAIGDLYRAMDVCIVPSRSEGFSLAVAEAWFCETPVAATAVGIAAEHPDFVIPLPHEPDAAALEAAMNLSLSRDPPYRTGDAQAMVRTTYSIERMIADWRSFLEAKLPGLLD